MHCIMEAFFTITCLALLHYVNAGAAVDSGLPQQRRSKEEGDVTAKYHHQATLRNKKNRKQDNKADLSRCIKGAKPSSGGSAGISNLCCPLSPWPLHALLDTIRRTCIQCKQASRPQSASGLQQQLSKCNATCSKETPWA